MAMLFCSALGPAVGVCAISSPLGFSVSDISLKGTLRRKHELILNERPYVFIVISRVCFIKA